MKTFRQKLILLLTVSVFVPIAIVGLLASTSMREINHERIKEIRSLLIKNEHERLAQMARNQAMLLDQILSDHQETVKLLSEQYEQNLAEYPKSKGLSGPPYYTDRDCAGLPGYGYVHPKYGAYADWERVAGGASPWIPKHVIDRARVDEQYRDLVIDTLYKAMTLRSSFMTYQQTHVDMISMIWLATTVGVAYAFPTDYIASVDANPTMIDLDQTQETYVRDYGPENDPQREARWTRVYLDAFQSKFMTSYVAPIYDKDVFVGTIGIDLLLPDLVELISKGHIGDHGYAFLLDAQGRAVALHEQGLSDWIAKPEQRDALKRVMASDPWDEWTQQTVRQAEQPLRDAAPPECQSVLSAIANDPSGAVSIFLGGEEKFLSFCLVPAINWKVVYVRPVKEITAVAVAVQQDIERQARAATYAFAATLLFVVIMSVLVGIWASRQVTKPIAKIVQAADQIAKDPAHAPEIVIQRRDEFQSLAESLNTMTGTLRRSEAKYRELVENANSIILRFDLQGRVTFYNEYAQKFFGYSEEEILGKHVVGTIVPKIDSAGHDLSDMTRGLLHAPQHYAYNENENIRKNGERVWVSWSNKLIAVSEDGSMEILAVGNDITERRRMEKQLLQAQRMEAVGQLAGGVAHDFNNLLQAILGYIDMASCNIQQSDLCRSNLQDAYRAAERASVITRQLLAFSRRQVLKLEPMDLNNVVEDIIRMIRRLIGENITLLLSHSSEPVVLLADRGQVEQVIINLCINARDAMPNGGELVLATNLVTEQGEGNVHKGLKKGNYVQLTVKDTGCGMDAQTIKQIFEPFFTTKEPGKGTGLGLSTIYGIVHQHEGLINVTSEPGKGSEFKVWWPACSAATRQPEDRSVEPPRGGTETILLAEDEEQLRRLAKIILEKAGYRVLDAHDGHDAVNVFNRHRDEIDMLVLDVVMPSKGGQLVYEEVTALKPRIKCLFASGYSEVAHTNFIMENNLHLIRKPYRREDLLRSIRKILDA